MRRLKIFKFKPPAKRIKIDSIHMLQIKKFDEVISAPTAEIKQASKAITRAEETPKPFSIARRTASKNWL